MNIQSYLEKHSETRASFAQRIGVNPSNVTRFISGERVPSGPTLARIVAATNGEVSFPDFNWDKETAA